MSLAFRTLHPHFAAEVSPVDLRRADDHETLARIRAGMDADIEKLLAIERATVERG